MQLDKYQKKSSDLSALIERVGQISDELKMENSSKQIANVVARLDEEVFRLVVVGEFSRGKSTFVNALLRRKVLPAFKNPTTAIISKIVYGTKPNFKIYYKGRSAPQSLSEEDFKKLIASKEPDETDAASVKEFIKSQEFFSSVDYAEISYPLDFCKNGVEIVDTPGTNDLNVGRMEITYGYLNRADAVIMMLSATQPLSKSESKFLHERIIGNRINDIFFVISQKDDLNDESECQRVIDFVSENLEKILPPSINLKNRIFLVSGFGALLYHMHLRGEKLTTKQSLKVPDNFDETGFPTLEFSLGKFLSEEKGAVRLKRYGREALAVIGTMQHDISVKIGVTSHSADDIRAKVSTFENVFNQSKRKAKVITSNMKRAFDYFVDSIDGKCRTASTRIIDSAQQSLDSITEGMSSIEIQQIIERSVAEHKSQFIENVMREWKNILADENYEAQKELSKIWDDIDITYKKEFSLTKIEEDSTALNITIPEEETNAVQLFSKLADGSWENIFKAGTAVSEKLTSAVAFVASSVLFVGASIWNVIFGNNPPEKRRSTIRTQIYESYQKNSKEMAKTLKEKFRTQIEEFCSSVEKDVDDRIDDMERQFKEILAEKESTEHNVKQQSEYLNQKLKELKNINNEIVTLVS